MENVSSALESLHDELMWRADQELRVLQTVNVKAFPRLRRALGVYQRRAGWAMSGSLRCPALPCAAGTVGGGWRLCVVQCMHGVWGQVVGRNPSTACSLHAAYARVSSILWI